MSEWTRGEPNGRTFFVRWDTKWDAPVYVPLSLEQAIIRSHPQVVALVEAARLGLWHLDNDEGIRYPHAINVLNAALAPWEETNG